MQYKQYTISKNIKETEDGLQIDFVISTGDIDRDFDKINPQGWQMQEYRKNPVILWAHDTRTPPIAKSLKEWIEEDTLRATALFTPADLNPFGYSIGRMYQEGFLSAVSVGFRPIKYVWVEDQNRPYGIDFEEVELLEFSAVPVPANPAALISAKAAGIDLTPLIKWAEELIETQQDPQALAIHQALAPHKSISIPSKIALYKVRVL